MKVCPSCGRMFPDMQRFCSFDGCDLILDSQPSAANMQNTQPPLETPVNSYSSAPNNTYAQTTYQQAPYTQNMYQQSPYVQNTYQQSSYVQNTYQQSPYVQSASYNNGQAYVQTGMPFPGALKRYMTRRAKTWLIVLTILSMFLLSGIFLCNTIRFGVLNALRQGLPILSVCVMLVLYILSDRIPNWVFGMLLGIGSLWTLLQTLYNILFRGMGLNPPQYFLFGTLLPWLLGVGIFVFFLLACLDKIKKVPALVTIGILLFLQMLMEVFLLYYMNTFFGYSMFGIWNTVSTILSLGNTFTILLTRFIYTNGMYKAREEAEGLWAPAPSSNYQQSYPNYPNYYQ